MKPLELLRSPTIGVDDPPYAASRLIARLALAGQCDKRGKPVYAHVESVLQRTLRHMKGAHAPDVRVSDVLVDANGRPLGSALREMADGKFTPKSYDEHLAVHGAILHDVIEDGDVSLKDLAEAGYSLGILCVVDLLTCEEGTPYVDYIDELCRTAHQDGSAFTAKDAPEVTVRRAALLVKAMDHADNTDPARMDGLTPAYRAPRCAIRRRGGEAPRGIRVPRRPSGAGWAA